MPGKIPQMAVLMISHRQVWKNQEGGIGARENAGLRKKLPRHELPEWLFPTCLCVIVIPFAVSYPVNWSLSVSLFFRCLAFHTHEGVGKGLKAFVGDFFVAFYAEAVFSLFYACQG